MAEWSRLVAEIRLEYCTSNNDLIPGRGGDYIVDYMVVMGYMVVLASQYEYNLSKAITLQEKVVKVSEQEASVAVALPLDTSLDATQRQQLSNLAGSLSRLGDFRADVGNARCVTDYQRAIAIFKRIGEKAGEAMVEWNLGNAYKNLSEIRDFDAAESAYKCSLNLLDRNDAWGRSKCIRQIGVLYFEKLLQARERNESPEVLKKYMERAEEHYLTALNLCPAEALGELSEIHDKLGNLYLLFNLSLAREQYELAATLADKVGDRFNAAVARLHIALTYRKAAKEAQEPSQQRGNLERARAYAEAALRDSEYYGEHAAEQAQAIRGLLNDINQALLELGQ